MKNYITATILLFVIFAGHTPNVLAQEKFKIGFIGAMTGPFSSYGGYKAVSMAIDDINARGGILGRPVELIAEDGKGNGLTAVTAMHKLINIDKVKYVLGGHSSPESVPIAPIAEANKVIMLATVSASPALTNAGDYVFRTCPASTKQSERLFDYLKTKKEIKSIGILYEETAYAQPMAEKLKELAIPAGINVAFFEGYNSEETDFRLLLIKLKGKKVDALIFSPQNTESAMLVLAQQKNLHLNLPIIGNDVLGGLPLPEEQKAALTEGIVYAEPEFSSEGEDYINFAKRYNQRSGVGDLQFGMWMAESYDGARILADVINRCGDDTEKVKQCLYQVKDYPGISGKISIDSNGDGLRAFKLIQIVNGKKQSIE
ncbi:MAG: ABC transporter substrate-binding protein [Deltaproteobacteria bacterium]|nr:ABC transporter substrate-binding protein [Deltaproteobacteria bacterium]